MLPSLHLTIYFEFNGMIDGYKLIFKILHLKLNMNIQCYSIEKYNIKYTNRYNVVLLLSMRDYYILYNILDKMNFKTYNKNFNGGAGPNRSGKGKRQTVHLPRASYYKIYSNGILYCMYLYVLYNKKNENNFWEF